jgi:Uma2 family endonuclease
VGTAVHAERLTLEAWGALPEDTPGELVDGRLVEEEVPSAAHELVVSWLIWVFRNWLAGTRALVLGSESKLAVRRDRGRKPDVLVWLPGQARPARSASLHTRPPSIVVEVVSATPKDGRRDRIDKADDYAAFGVRWYWLVDTGLRTLEILELGADGRYARALGAGGGVLPAIPGCQGLRLELDALWAEIDELGEDPQ